MGVIAARRPAWRVLLASAAIAAAAAAAAGTAAAHVAAPVTHTHIVADDGTVNSED